MVCNSLFSSLNDFSFKKENMVGGPGDGGIDLHLKDSAGLSALVQCKCKSFRYKVQLDDVVKFKDDVLRFASARQPSGCGLQLAHCFFVTTTQFSDRARESGFAAGDCLIHMWGHEELVALLARQHALLRDDAAVRSVLDLAHPSPPSSLQTSGKAPAAGRVADAERVTEEGGGALSKAGVEHAGGGECSAAQSLSMEEVLAGMALTSENSGQEGATLGSEECMDVREAGLAGADGRGPRVVGVGVHVERVPLSELQSSPLLQQQQPVPRTQSSARKNLKVIAQDTPSKRQRIQWSEWPAADDALYEGIAEHGTSWAKILNDPKYAAIFSEMFSKYEQYSESKQGYKTLRQTALKDRARNLGLLGVKSNSTASEAACKTLFQNNSPASDSEPVFLPVDDATESEEEEEGRSVEGSEKTCESQEEGLAAAEV